MRYPPGQTNERLAVIGPYSYSVSHDLAKGIPESVSLQQLESYRVKENYRPIYTEIAQGEKIPLPQRRTDEQTHQRIIFMKRKKHRRHRTGISQSTPLPTINRAPTEINWPFRHMVPFD